MGLANLQFVQYIDDPLRTSHSQLYDYTVNSYIGCAHKCRYCYAINTSKPRDAGISTRKQITVRYWPEIQAPERYKGKRIFLSSATDPYQPAEARYRRTRRFLEEMRDSQSLICITTKSNLVEEDLDLIKEFPNAMVSWSINTLDEDLCRQMDTAVPIELRRAAMSTFHRAGIGTSCNIEPVIPGVTNVLEIMEALLPICNRFVIGRLNMASSGHDSMREWIDRTMPHLTGLYHDIYDTKNNSYWTNLLRDVKRYAETVGLNYSEYEQINGQTVAYCSG